MKLSRLPWHQLKQRILQYIKNLNNWNYMQRNLSDTSIIIVTSHMDLRKAAEKMLGMKKM